jgi:hypothetical protein
MHKHALPGAKNNKYKNTSVSYMNREREGERVAT